MKEIPRDNTDRSDRTPSASAAVNLPAQPGAITRRKPPAETSSNGRRIVSAVAAGALGLTAAGCGAMGAEDIKELPAAQRFDYDYAGGNNNSAAPKSAQPDCLRGSPYDPFQSRPSADGAAPGSVLTESDGTIKVVPSNESNGAPILEFEPPANSAAGEGQAPLEPANDVTQRVLDSYGCKTTYEN